MHLFLSVSPHHLHISPLFLSHLSGLPAFAPWVQETVPVRDVLCALDEVTQSGHSATAIQDDAVFILGAEGQRDLRADIKHHRTQLHKSGAGETDRVDVLQCGRDRAMGYRDRKKTCRTFYEKKKGETSMLQPLVSPV